MSKEIWLGPLLGNNRSRLVKRCADLVAEGKGDTFLYLAASHPLLELVTEQILDGAKNRGVWGELPVYLFRGFVRRLISTAVDEETGDRLSPRTPIDREELPLKRSLISQLLLRLKAQGKLKAIAPLAGSEGCVNTIVRLVGELERAAKTPAELENIVAARSQDQIDAKDRQASPTKAPPLQIDFDREVALIYRSYSEALARFGLTEEDADQLRALQILRGEAGGIKLIVPWLSPVDLLVLDGFFDFTPVQGEMLRVLIPQVPQVVVNLNHDERNPEIFQAFRETIEQLHGIASFEVKQHSELNAVKGTLSVLRENLFNPANSQHSENSSESKKETHANGPDKQSEIRLLDCTDRETEIRAIAKEIKRLITSESVHLADIGLVVRERESYAETISRVLKEESIPCDLQRSIETLQIPAIRAARKVFEVLAELSDHATAGIKVSTLADLIKSEYFRLAESDLETLSNQFEQQYAALLHTEDNGDPATFDSEREERLRAQCGIGRWDADSLENVIAYVGAELRVTDWLARARRLLEKWPQVKVTKKLAAPDPNTVQDDEVESRIEDADKIPPEERGEKKRRPSRDVPPASIAWASLVVERLSDLIKSVPHEGQPLELRQSVMQLLEQLQFYRQTRRALRRPMKLGTHDNELPHAMLDLRGLEALRRGFVAAIRSFEIADAVLPHRRPDGPVSLQYFLSEVSRCLSSQIQETSGLERSGLRVLAATDIRGLSFRALFVAGLVEGGFPLRASRDWIYPHEERERLKQFGLTLEDISPATLLKEEHYFYQAACRATERLYLLRPLLMEDGSETVASYYIDELRRAIEPAQIVTKISRRDFDGKEVLSASTPAELARSLVRQEERHRHFPGTRDLLPPAQVERFVAWAKENDFVSSSALQRIEIEHERWSEAFSRYDGRIVEPNLLRMLGNHFGSDFVHSASGLSMYGNCPYKFFASRVLKLEPRGEAALDLQALDAGKLLHDILRRFFEFHRGERMGRENMEALRAELARIADQVFDEHESVVPPLNPNIWKLDREIRKILLDQVLLFELGVQEKTKQDVRPAHFEVAFGMTLRQPTDPISTVEPLELSRSSLTEEEKIKIQGQIDRVDVSADKTLIAYDYKLSSGSNREDMTAGRTFQVPIYLEALERLILPSYSIAGGGYYILRGGSSRRNKGIYRVSHSGYTGLQARNSVFGDDDWQKIRDEVIAKIWEFLDHMRAGEFVVTPSEGYKTCRWCDFAAVCRYDKYRIQRKKDHPQITPISQIIN